MNTPNIKGYELATDYEKLHDLVMAGHRIPCWITPENQYPDIWTISEIKISQSTKEWDIKGWITLRKDINSFIDICQKLNLHYIPPSQ